MDVAGGCPEADVIGILLDVTMWPKTFKGWN